jgi:nitric oxide reductase subunit B
MTVKSKRALLVSNGWVQAVVILLLFGFFVLGFLAYPTYTGGRPIPGRVADASGRVLFTRADILDGQQVFLRNGLMEYGPIFGHEAYLGPDFTADYLHRAALTTLDFYRQAGSDRAQARTIADFKTNRYERASDTLTLTQAEVAAFSQLRGHYQIYFGHESSQHGLRPDAIADAHQIADLTAFFAWSAWASATLRPGQPYSYTNN